VGSLLLLANHTIDAEDYPEAEKLLEQIAAVNPCTGGVGLWGSAGAFAKPATGGTIGARGSPEILATNPRVEYLIGLKLAQNYRFAEGAAHQRQALAFDEHYLPAKAQLAQDLLRWAKRLKDGDSRRRCRNKMATT